MVMKKIKTILGGVKIVAQIIFMIMLEIDQLMSSLLEIGIFFTTPQMRRNPI
jgi:hypothetical protein